MEYGTDHDKSDGMVSDQSWAHPSAIDWDGSVSIEAACRKARIRSMP